MIFLQRSQVPIFHPATLKIGGIPIVLEMSRPYYDEMLDLYDRFVEGRLDAHYTAYFDRLRIYFEQGELITRIHALELILNIVLGGKWTGLGTRPVKQTPLSSIGKKQVQLQQFSSSKIQVKSPVHDLKKTEVQTIIDWLYETLPKEKEEDILKVFFIFIKTHWYQLNIEEPHQFAILYELHQELLKNPKYGKLEALERLHRQYFSTSYTPLK